MSVGEEDKVYEKILRDDIKKFDAFTFSAGKLVDSVLQQCVVTAVLIVLTISKDVPSRVDFST